MFNLQAILSRLVYRIRFPQKKKFLKFVNSPVKL